MAICFDRGLIAAPEPFADVASGLQLVVPDSAKPLMCPVSELMVRIAMRFRRTHLPTSSVEWDLQRTARKGPAVMVRLLTCVSRRRTQRRPPRWTPSR